MLHALNDPSLGKVIWAHFQQNPVAWKQPYIIDTHPA